jgi:hypothetical protein
MKVPENTPAGTYKGSITVQADGQPPAVVPVEAEIVGWRMPNARELQTFVQCEQSPYGIARQYKVELWSDKHWQLIETSFRQLGRLGNRWVIIPVLMNSELGNRDDVMVRWIRKKDGTLDFDWSLVDRYLSVAQ